MEIKIIRGSLRFSMLISSYPFLNKEELDRIFPGWKEALKLETPKTARN